MMDELAGRVQAFAAMTKKARGIGLGVEVEEKSAVHHSQATVKHVKAVLKFTCSKTTAQMK